MSERAPKTFEAEARETAAKSAVSGVAATMLAITTFSPAGLGGVVGTSLASGLGVDPTATSSDDNVYANLPPFSTPLTAQELSEIRGQLARTTASLEITRAATDEKIEKLRELAQSSDLVEFTSPVRASSRVAENAVNRAQPVQPVVAPVQEAAAPVSAATPVSFSQVNNLEQPRDRDLELAELLLAHENI